MMSSYSTEDDDDDDANKDAAADQHERMVDQSSSCRRMSSSGESHGSSRQPQQQQQQRNNHQIENVGAADKTSHSKNGIVSKDGYRRCASMGTFLPKGMMNNQQEHYYDDDDDVPFGSGLSPGKNKKKTIGWTTGSTGDAAGSKRNNHMARRENYKVRSWAQQKQKQRQRKRERTRSLARHSKVQEQQQDFLSFCSNMGEEEEEEGEEDLQEHNKNALTTTISKPPSPTSIKGSMTMVSMNGSSQSSIHSTTPAKSEIRRRISRQHEKQARDTRNNNRDTLEQRNFALSLANIDGLTCRDLETSPLFVWATDRNIGNHSERHAGGDDDTSNDHPGAAASLDEETIRTQQHHGDFLYYLKSLSLAGNASLGGGWGSSIPPCLVQNHVNSLLFPLLTKLNLSGCGLKTLPDNWNMPSLQCLDLSRNALTQLLDVASLCGLPNLIDLNLYHNRIEHIQLPSEQEGPVLPQLEKLNLGWNNLHDLPEELSQCRKLQSLRLDSNYIRVLPAVIVNLPELTRLAVERNHWFEPPRFYMEGGLPKMRKYYHDLATSTTGGVIGNQETAAPMRDAVDENEETTVSSLGDDITESTEDDDEATATFGVNPDNGLQWLERSIVQVGLWDDVTKQNFGIGTGFVVSRRHRLIVTAAHTLIDIMGSPLGTFGMDCKGLMHGRIFVGIIPRYSDKSSMVSSSNTPRQCVFRYNAEIVAKDPRMERGICRTDACVLRITSRMENDVGGNGDSCTNEGVHLLPGCEDLPALRLSEDYQLGNEVTLTGFGQENIEDLPNFLDFRLNHWLESVPGTIYSHDVSVFGQRRLRHLRFFPQDEIAIETMGLVTRVGASGGPCISKIDGKVIGLISHVMQLRDDEIEGGYREVTYIVPTRDWKPLVRMAKRRARKQQLL